jgi:drug/metabolite transporter (DMT)-like permease
VPDHISRPTMSGREWAILLILAMLWGGSFFFNGVAVRELPSFTIVWLRVASAAAALLIVLPLVGCRIPMQGRGWLAFFGMGLLNNVLPLALIVWGQHRIASGLASFLCRQSIASRRLGATAPSGSCHGRFCASDLDTRAR